MRAQTPGLVKSVVSREFSDPITRKTLPPPPIGQTPLYDPVSKKEDVLQNTWFY